MSFKDNNLIPRIQTLALNELQRFEVKTNAIFLLKHY